MTGPPDGPTAADLRGRVLAALDPPNPDGGSHAVEHVTTGLPPWFPPGYAVWRLHGQTACTMLPALADSAPMSVHRRYHARFVANLTGRCGLCDAVASVSADPEQHRAGWTVAPVTVALVHAPDCPATFAEADRVHFDPRAVGGGGQQDGDGERGERGEP